MTRRQVLSETLKLTGLLCVGMALPAGCGGEEKTGANEATISEARRVELENMGKASGAASKAAKKK